MSTPLENITLRETLVFYCHCAISLRGSSPAAARVSWLSAELYRGKSVHLRGTLRPSVCSEEGLTAAHLTWELALEASCWGNS